MRGLRFWTSLPLLLVFSCGGGGGGGGSSDGNQPTAVPTVTTVATPSPVPTVSVALSVSSGIDAAAVSFTIGYEVGRVALLGSGAQAQCRLASNDTIALNDDDAGTLRVAIVPADPLQRQTLALPTTFSCDFAENGGSVSAGALRIGSMKIGVIDATGVVVEGDTSRLDVH